ncbi:MAG: pilus assembly protein, partial [Solirubrobacteraceae bacterium]
AYNSTNTTNYVIALAKNWGVPLAAADIALANTGACAGVTAPNGFSSVTITYNFQSVVPKLVTALGAGETLTSTACFPNY